MNNIEQLRKWCNGVWLAKANSDASIEELAIDSRNIENATATLFIPIKTTLRDGHNYLHDAWQKGVRNFLVSEPTDTGVLAGANIIQVKDTLAALQQTAAAHRKQFGIPVI